MWRHFAIPLVIRVACCSSIDSVELVEHSPVGRAMTHLLSQEQWRSVVQTTSGLGAGALSTVLLYPLDLVKVRYQVHDRSRHAYRSLGHAFRGIVADEGASALFRGMSPALYGSAISWGLYMMFYQNAKDRYARLAEDGLIRGSWQYFFAGIEAGLLCVPLTNPIWLVKIRMQVQSTTRLHQQAAGKDAALKLAKTVPYRSVTGTPCCWIACGIGCIVMRVCTVPFG